MNPLRFPLPGALNFTDLTTLNLVFNSSGGGVLRSDGFWGADHTWTLYDVAGVTTHFTNLSLVSANWLDSGSNAFDSTRPDAGFYLSQSGQDVMLNYSAVPEPRAALIGGLGMLMLLRRCRKVRV